MSEKGGGPAFPSNNERTENGAIWAEINDGMSLRDYFAAAALSHVPKLLEVNNKNLTATMIAEWSYEMSDAMLRERERSGS
jgi:hypothetical protein